jgi:hypothetical protein
MEYRKRQKKRSGKGIRLALIVRGLAVVTEQDMSKLVRYRPVASPRNGFLVVKNIVFSSVPNRQPFKLARSVKLASRYTRCLTVGGKAVKDNLDRQAQSPRVKVRKTVKGETRLVEKQIRRRQLGFSDVKRHFTSDLFLRELT